MLTGLIEYGGTHYLLREEGELRGAAVIGEIEYKGVNLAFDEEGKLISAS